MFMLVWSIGLSAAGFFMLNKSRILMRDGIRVSAKVVANNRSCDGEGCSYNAVLELIHTDGSIKRIEDSMSSNPASFDVGERVFVYYNTEYPDTLLVDTFFRKFGFSLIFIVPGVLAFLFAIKYIIGKKTYKERYSANDQKDEAA